MNKIVNTARYGAFGTHSPRPLLFNYGIVELVDVDGTVRNLGTVKQLSKLAHEKKLALTVPASPGKTNTKDLLTVIDSLSMLEK